MPKPLEIRPSRTTDAYNLSMIGEEGETCPLPVPPEQAEREMLRRIVGNLATSRVAVVGLSADPSRASYQIAGYLIGEGVEVVPVNPNCAAVLGLRCYASLQEVPEKIDLVDVFRRPEHCAEIVRDAIAAGAGAVWLQSGIRNAEAQRLAVDAGLDFVQDRCLMVEHMRRGRR